MGLFPFGRAKKESFYSKLESFIDSSFRRDIPADVIAVCFNLYENEKHKWCM